MQRIESVARGVSFAAALVISALTMLPGASAALDRSADRYHTDYRSTPKLQFAPDWTEPAGLTGEAMARAYLSERATVYELPADLANLRLDGARESLLGTHFVFQQTIGAYDLETAQIIVSIAKSDGAMYRVYNTTYPMKASLPQPGTILSDDASYDLAWQSLRAHGELIADPTYHVRYVPQGERFELQAIVELGLDAPFGYWRVRLDAITGAILAIEDTSLPRMKVDGPPIEERIAEFSGPVADRHAAFDRYFSQAHAHDAERSASASAGGQRLMANGTGQVFDPDPRTTLQNETLQDGSPAGSFTAAYVNRALLDITFNGSVYSLTGPWITISNFESPNTAPSTTANGLWTAARGVNSFNDALTYFHIDQNQRYMQSLGFTGGSGIQQGSIVTDTDGLSGADNSHFVPSSNRMAFGHGCVDDSEDADVVLHEYGHAIHYSINSNWGGGDSGAIGEGFGDYWAGSYSYSALNGQTFRPEWVFSWDGHGSPAQCWPGRILNAFGAQYDPNSTYGAHQGIPGGFQSDELWSTPLFQSLTALVALGRPRSEVDQIILEAHFGLGSGVRMPDLAYATIATAELLQPGGPHADVFIQKFLVHNIIDVPAVGLLVQTTSLSEAGANGVADPGETVHLSIELENGGTLGATEVSGTLSTSTPGVTIEAGASAYPDLPIGASAINSVDYVLSIAADFECGDPIDLTLTVDFEGESFASTLLPIELGTGVVLGVSQSVTPGLAIPDNNTTGITSTMTIAGTGATVTASFNVDLAITHPYIGDLKVSLRSPNNTTVILHNRTGGSADNVIGNYPGTLTPNQPLSAFIGQPLDGDWKMIVADLAGQDIGVLNAWGINDIQGYECTQAASVPEAGLSVPFELLPARPNPFTTESTLQFAISRAGEAMSLEILDVSGRRIRTLEAGLLAPGEHSRVWDLRDDQGRPVGAGVYFSRLRQGGREATRKLLLVR